MLALYLPSAEFAFKQANRCLFCFSKLSWSAHNDKTFPVSEFNDAWSHLVPDEEIEFSVTPPVCALCETTLKKLYKALMQLTEATISIKETVAKSGRNGSSLGEDFANLLEDLKQCEIEDRCRRGALALLEKLGHEEVFEEDYQAWFPPDNGKKDYEQTLERNTSEADAVSNMEPDDYSPLNVYPSGDEESDAHGAVELQSERRQTDDSGKLNGPRKRRGSARKSARRKDNQVDTEENDVERGSGSDADPDYVSQVEPPVVPTKKKRIHKPRPNRKRYKKASLDGSVTGRIRKGMQSCDFCREGVPLDNIKEHIESHVGDYALPCPNPDCKFVFATHTKLLHHCQQSSCKGFISRNKFRTCETCGHQAINSAALLTHLIDYHGTDEKPFSCPVSSCPESFSTRQAVHCHIRRHSVDAQTGKGAWIAPPGRQKCSNCRQIFRQEDIRSHLETVHEITPESVIACRSCPYLFSCWDHLLDHMHSHITNGIRVNCYLCPSGEFSKLAHLKQHYWEKHGLGKLHKCDQCSTMALSASGLAWHKKFVHSSDPSLKRPSTQNRPLRKCNKCPRAFRLYNDLVAHKIRVHGEDVLECDLCGETFLYPQYLSRHKNLVHNGIAKAATNHHKPRSPQVKKVVKSYLCRICGKEFKDNRNLWSHEKYTHKTATFACLLCGRRFKTRKSLVRHEGNKLCTNTSQGTLSGVTVKKYEKLRNDPETASTAHLPDVLQSDNRTPFVCDQCGKGFSYNCWLKRHQRQVHSLTKAPENETIVEQSLPHSKQ